MQSSAFALSQSIPLLKPRRPSTLTSTSRFDPIRLSSSSKSSNYASVNGLSASMCCRSELSSSPSRLNAWCSVPSLLSDRKRRDVEVRATASEGESAKSSSMAQTLQLGSLFGLWYLFNIYFNIYNKQVLKVFPYPMTITTVQFAVGTVLVILMWTSNLYRRPKISSAQLVAILPLAVVHTLGNLFTNMSLGKVAVSFTHTIKAMEPFFSVVLSAMFLGELPTLWVVSSLVPIVGGVALASVTEASFNWAGFWSAMASNVTNQSRNVLSKKFMVKKEESLDNITLFSIITIMSFMLLAPVTFFTEGVKVTPAFMQSAGLNVQQDMRQQANETGEAAAIPITKRQLEAIIRLSESLAKMRLSHVATEENVQEALRLFNVSTMDAAKSGINQHMNLTPKMVRALLEMWIIDGV